MHCSNKRTASSYGKILFLGIKPRRKAQLFSLQIIVREMLRFMWKSLELIRICLPEVIFLQKKRQKGNFYRLMAEFFICAKSSMCEQIFPQKFWCKEIEPYVSPYKIVPQYVTCMMFVGVLSSSVPYSIFLPYTTQRW